MKLVVAVDNEWGIGYKGDLLARIRADLLNFRRLTDGHTVVLGSNTLATFPGGKALKNRVNIVLHPSEEYRPEGALVAHSLGQALEMLKERDPENAFIIGGASIYRQFLPYCDTAYVTKFKKSYDKDVYFEDLDTSVEWELVEESESHKSDPTTDTDPDLEYTFCVYKRVRPAVIIREAASGDEETVYELLKGIASLHRAIRPDLFGQVISKYSVEEIGNMIASGDKKIFVAECGEKVRGYLIAWAVNDGVKTLYVDDLCVEPGFRRRGAATKLMQRAESFGREQGCRFLLLNVWSGNSEAEEFYKRYGMVERSKHLEKRL